MIDVKNDPSLPTPMDDPVLLEYMLQHLYGLYYLEEPEEDDVSSTYSSQGKQSKEFRKRFTLVDEEIRRQDELIPHGDESIPSDHEPNCIPGGNATIHAQMCAIADFYGIPDLQKIARHKFRAALNRLRDVQRIVELFNLVCNPELQNDAVLRDMMVDKVVRHKELLDNPKVEAILHEDGELTLAIAKRLR